MNRAIQLSFQRLALRGFATNGIKTLSRSPFCLPLAAQARCMGGHTPAHFKPQKEVMMETRSHMNLMPVPEGSWQEDYKKTQMFYNVLMVGSAVALCFTFMFYRKAGFYYMHDFEDFKEYKPKSFIGYSDVKTT